MTDLSAEAITAALTTRRLGRPVLYFPRTASTNDVAHERAAAGAAEGLLVIADEQTAGRGRLDRRWWAPPGSSPWTTSSATQTTVQPREAAHTRPRARGR